MRRLVLLPLLLLVLTPCAEADSATRKALAALKAARNPAQRIAAIGKLEASGGDQAAAALARLVAGDPAIEVRVRAAHALGRTRAESARELLFERVVDGGPLAVRDAVAWALAKKAKGARLLTAGLEQARRTTLERGLLLRALGAMRDEGTRDTLLRWIDDPDPYLGAEALRGLVARADGDGATVALLVRLLRERRDASGLLPVLDAAEPALDPALRLALQRLTTFLEPAVVEAADHLLRVLDARVVAETEPQPAKGGDRYGTPEAPPPTRIPGDVPTRSRHDLVYLLDVTGSTVMTLPALQDRIRQEIDLLVGLGLNLRVGFIAYRGGQGMQARLRGLEVLPLTYDPTRVHAFVADLKSGGVDDRGASAALALRVALDRMGWRVGARRTVQLIADGPCEDEADAIARAGIHYRAERTRTKVAYVLRTRTQVPAELDRIAKAGGTGAVEVLE